MMFNTLLFLHLVIGLLLIIAILLQKTSADGVTNSGASTGTGLMTPKAAANFMTRITITFGVVFFVSSLALGNLSIQSSSITKKIQTTTERSNSVIQD